MQSQAEQQTTSEGETKVKKQMLISIKKKFVFFSNPKCGTTSIEARLSPLCEISINGTRDGKHLKPSDFTSWETLLRQYHSCEKLLKICTTRHPIEKLISWYTYRSRPELKIKNSQRYLGNTDFSEWCRQEMKKDHDEWFFQSSNDKLDVDIVVPIKYIHKLEKLFSNLFCKNIRFPSRNASPKRKDLFSTSELYKLAERELKYAHPSFHHRIKMHHQIEAICSKPNALEDINFNKELFSQSL